MITFGEESLDRKRRFGAIGRGETHIERVIRRPLAGYEMSSLVENYLS